MRVHKKMSKTMFTKKIRKMKCFVKHINVNHLMPTRYSTSGELELRSVFKEAISKADKHSLKAAMRHDLAKNVKKVFREKYENLPEIRKPNDKASNVQFFFEKLRF